MKTLITLVLATFGSYAMADGVIRPSVSYSIHKTESGGTTSETTTRYIDLAGGWVGPSGFSVLGIYGSQNESTSPGGSSSDRTSLGAGVGYTKGEGIFAAAFYFVQNSLTSGSTKYEGDGMQFDIGYLFKAGSAAIGPQFSYRMHNFKKVNGQTMANPLKVTDLDPMIAFQFMF